MRARPSGSIARAAASSPASGSKTCNSTVSHYYTIDTDARRTGYNSEYVCCSTIITCPAVSSSSAYR
ncbi:MAG TPA: hypothetical protein VJK47_02890 [Dehalococcoidales bacterium]|nr:hypothetical protein [Dehalococcoidales bacterium]